MSQALRVLIIEDSEDDTLLLLRELRRGGYDPIYERVENAEAMQAALARQSWDLILADYSLPRFSAPAALSLLQESGLDVPFIIVSGTVGEDVAVAALKAGAHDFLLKGKPARLIPAVARELREAQRRQEHQQAEEALATERRHLRTLIDHLPDFIYLKDREGRFIIGNSAVARAMGAAAPDELIGKTDFDFYPHDLAAEYHQNEQQVIRSGQAVINREEPMINEAGNRGWVLTSQVPLRDQQGQIVGLVGIGHDITPQKQAEAEIRRRNRELALLNEVIAASAAGLEPEEVLNIACRELALTFDVPYANAALLDEEKAVARMVADYAAEGSPQERPKMLHRTFQVAANPVFQYLLNHKKPLVVADASHDPHLARFQDLLRRRGVASILFLPLIIEGDVAGGLGLEAIKPRHFSPEEINLAWSVADQVAGALARARLTQLHQRLSAAIEQASESVIITDTEGIIIYVNPAFESISGYSRAEAIGRNPRFLKSGEHDDHFYETLWATINAGQVWHSRVVNKKKDGTLYTDEATITPVRDESGALINYVSVQRDVTRELQLERQYRQAQKMEAVGQLTAGIAHDFNNMIMAITGSAQMMQMQIQPEDPVYALTNTILQAGSGAAELIRQLLIFSRKQVMAPQVVELNTVVSETSQLLERIIGENIEIKLNLAANLWRVKVDPAQIEQVVVNLMVNARDAMPDGGRLILETANVVLDEVYTAGHIEVQPGEYVLLTVSDTGIGMSREVQSHLFEPFFTTKEVGKGTGLGLATVYGIVKQSGGHIWVYSEVGQGSTFKVYLPRTTEVATPSSPPPSPKELTHGHETILVVEDDDAIRMLARDVLKKYGYTILEAENSQEALQVATRHTGPIHLLLTDVIMPGMNGKALASELVKQHPHLKVIFMSGYTDEAISHQGILEAGMAFLQKPFSFIEMARKVQEFLET